MQRWICISNRINDSITQKKKIWGVSKNYSNLVSQVNIGDTLLMYARSEICCGEIFPSVIVSEYEVISKVYEDTNQLFEPYKNNPAEKFPIRVKVELIRIFDEPIPFKPLIPHLTFIKNKEMWTGSIRKPMRIIPEVDYQLIIKNINNSK